MSRSLGPICAGLWLLTGCTSNDPLPDHRFSTIQRRVFDVNCAMVCHSTAGAMSSGQLDLSEGHSYAELVNVAAKNVGAIEDGLLRVKPGDPEKSLLYIKVAGHTPIAYGTPMPQSGVSLSAPAIEAIRAWIAEGAPNN